VIETPNAIEIESNDLKIREVAELPVARSMVEVTMGMDHPARRTG